MGLALSAEQSHSFDYNANTECCVLCVARTKVASTKMIGQCSLLSR